MVDIDLKIYIFLAYKWKTPKHIFKNSIQVPRISRREIATPFNVFWVYWPLSQALHVYSYSKSFNLLLKICVIGFYQLLQG